MNWDGRISFFGGMEWDINIGMDWDGLVRWMDDFDGGMDWDRNIEKDWTDG